jgi:hypothetical protein
VTVEHNDALLTQKHVIRTLQALRLKPPLLAAPIRTKANAVSPP